MFKKTQFIHQFPQLAGCLQKKTAGSYTFVLTKPAVSAVSLETILPGYFSALFVIKTVK